MNADFSERRVKMVDGQVRTTDVTSAPLIEAMLSVPREAFVGAGQQDLAYIDEDIRISDGANGGGARYLMEPSPLAKLLQLAEIDAGDSVLDVGCGTGYSAALLSRLARSVVALESDPALAEAARSTLSSLGCQNVTVVAGPLPQGQAAKAPYNVIFIGGSGPATTVTFWQPRLERVDLAASASAGSLSSATTERASRDSNAAE